jgi:hypothetical protein
MPKFSDLLDDFFVTNFKVFEKAKAEFLVEILKEFNLNGLFVLVGQFILAAGERIFGSSAELYTIHTWRKCAWNKAAFNLNKMRP